MPDAVPTSHDSWWCKADDEYAFLGFSYEVTSCQSKSKMTKEFKDIRERFKGRYIRMYGNCDKADFYDDLIDAAWEAGIGVHALIWFGWDNPDAWKSRKAAFMKAVKSNSKAPYVIRVLQFGSEPLFDSAISPGDLASQVKKAKKELSDYGIPVTVSEMAYGYTKSGGAKEVLEAIDSVNIHTLPFFSTKASTGGKAWSIVTDDLDWFHKQADGKKVIMSQNGWPSEQYDGVRPNSDAAVANIKNEKAYFDLLDSKCSYFKESPGGGVGWFAHLYSDYMEPGYGVLDGSGSPKFDFKPKTSC
ncbi:glycoside hydrolase superfamily [Flagelloscypha sp. PMI_526]|nr:glycoside hydrolase superfamily [Flagelloscypha sp. PMI_526]